MIVQDTMIHERIDRTKVGRILHIGRGPATGRVKIPVRLYETG